MVLTYMYDLISRDADSMVVRLRWNLTGRSRIELKRLRFASDFPSENCLLRGATPPTLGMIEIGRIARLQDAMTRRAKLPPPF